MQGFPPAHECVIILCIVCMCACACRFMDPSIDTSPIAPALQVSFATTRLCDLTHVGLWFDSRCHRAPKPGPGIAKLVAAGAMALHHEGGQLGWIRCASCVYEVAVPQHAVAARVPESCCPSLLFCPRPSLMMCWMPVCLSSTSRPLLTAWATSCSSTPSGQSDRHHQHPSALVLLPVCLCLGLCLVSVPLWLR